MDRIRNPGGGSHLPGCFSKVDSIHSLGGGLFWLNVIVWKIPFFLLLNSFILQVGSIHCRTLVPFILWWVPLNFRGFLLFFGGFTSFTSRFPMWWIRIRVFISLGYGSTFIQTRRSKKHQKVFLSKICIFSRYRVPRYPVPVLSYLGTYVPTFIPTF